MSSRVFCTCYKCRKKDVDKEIGLLILKSTRTRHCRQEHKKIQHSDSILGSSSGSRTDSILSFLDVNFSSESEMIQLAEFDRLTNDDELSNDASDLLENNEDTIITKDYSYTSENSMDTDYSKDVSTSNSIIDVLSLSEDLKVESISDSMIDVLSISEDSSDNISGMIHILKSVQWLYFKNNLITFMFKP